MARNFHQGKFMPKNLTKYKGDPRLIVYRSSWELIFMQFCDTRADVLEWSSEERIIFYTSPQDSRRHRYFPDFWMKIRKKGGEIEEVIVEIKPFAETQAPVSHKKMTKHWLQSVITYAKNEAKWAAARQYCEAKGIKFQILTERDLGV